MKDQMKARTAMDMAVNRVLAHTFEPKRPDSDLINLRAQHKLNMRVLTQAAQAENEAYKVRMLAQQAVAGTKVMLELLEEKLGLGGLRDQHNEQVMCSDCKEWTTFGESCCGATACEDGCPICQERA